MKENRTAMTPITYRYTLMGLLEEPNRYIPRTPVQTEALKYAADCMVKHRTAACVTAEQYSTIVMLCQNKNTQSRQCSNFRSAMNAAIRAVNIEVKQYKHDMIFTPNEKWGDG